MKIKNILYNAVVEGGGGATVKTVETTSDAFTPARTTPSAVTNTTSKPSAVTSSSKPSEFEMSVDDPDLLDGVTPDLALESKTKVEPSPKPQDTKAEAIKQAVQDKAVVATKPVTPPSKVTTKPVTDSLTNIKPTGTKPGVARDLTGYSPEEQAILKQMSNPAFEFTTKILKERKELESLKSSHYLQSEDGYTLSPEYKQLSQDIQYASAESNIWLQQLQKIDSGEEWQPFEGWSRDGQPVFGAKQAPTKLAEEQIRMAMNRCLQVKQEVTGQLQQIPQKYKSVIQNDNQIIKNKMQELFSWEKDSSILEQAIAVGDKEIPIKQIKQDITNLFPPYHRNSIGVEAAANMYVALRIYANEITALRQQLEVASIKKNEAIRGEPTGDTRPATKTGKAIGGVTTFDMSDLPVE